MTNAAVYLEPRAVALLVALRGGPRTAAVLRGSICDRSPRLCAELADQMTAMGLLMRVRNACPAHWALDSAGVRWLSENNVSVTLAVLSTILKSSHGGAKTKRKKV